jgi:hypothetical protein
MKTKHEHVDRMLLGSKEEWDLSYTFLPKNIFYMMWKNHHLWNQSATTLPTWLVGSQED